MGIRQSVSAFSGHPVACQTVDWVTWLFVLLAVANFIVGEYWPVRHKHNFKQPVLTKEWSFGIATFALFIALAFLGLGQMYPWWANTCIYVVALAVIVLCGWWCDLRWTIAGRIAATLGALVYVGVFGVGVFKQFDHENHIDLVFEESDALTSWRRTVIDYDLGRVKSYLTILDIPVPDKIPTIGVERGNSNCTSELNAAPRPTFLSTFKVGTQCIGDRHVLTSFYVNYVIESIPASKPIALNTRDPDSVERYLRFVVTNFAFASYLDWSFWGEQPDFGCGVNSGIGLVGRADLLWKIREALGKDFTDQLIAYSMRITIDDPLAGC